MTVHCMPLYLVLSIYEAATSAQSSCRTSVADLEAVAFADGASGNSLGVQLPAVAQLQLPSSQPDQGAAAHSGRSQQALTQAHEALMQQSMMAAAAASPPGGPELSSSSGQGQGQPMLPLGLQEQPSAKQHMLHAISDGAAMVQVRVLAATRNALNPPSMQIVIEWPVHEI